MRQCRVRIAISGDTLPAQRARRAAPPACRMNLIRNFSIIAHVDHGKSTLADRIIQLCGGLEEREMEAQVLDSNPIERERGITIKAQSVSLPYTARDGKTYQLNFIDTPGHVDFSYEVSRSLAACEGALLVVDAAQGVEAQSVANCYTAVEMGLEVVPVLNKIDLPTADIDKVKEEIEAVIGIHADDAIAISAKTGLNVRRGARSDRGAHSAAEAARYRSAAGADHRFLVRQLSRRGLARARDAGRDQAARQAAGDVDRAHARSRRVGVFTPKRSRSDKLGAGEVGWVTAVDQGRARRAGRRHAHAGAQPPHAAAAGFPENAAARVRRACSRSSPTIIRRCAKRWKNSSSTMPRCISSRKAPRRWASVSAAAFSACCTWTSCRSGWSANTI